MKEVFIVVRIDAVFRTLTGIGAEITSIYTTTDFKSALSNYRMKVREAREKFEDAEGCSVCVNDIIPENAQQDFIDMNSLSIRGNDLERINKTQFLFNHDRDFYSIQLIRSKVEDI